MTDPAPDRRTYFRNIATGDRGYLVERHGATHVKYDRPNVDQTVLYHADKWTQELATERRFNAHEVAKVAFAADRQLCVSLGLHKTSKVEWHSLPEDERIRWVKEGPKVSPGHLRQRLWVAVVGAVSGG